MATNVNSYREALPKIRELTRGWGCYYPEIRVLVHPISTRITYMFSRIGVSPNMVTYIGILFSAASIFFFYESQYIASFICYAIRLIMDYADGSLARYTQTFSNYGARLDLISDYFFYLSFWGAICIKLEDITQSAILVSVALLYVLVVDYYVEPRLKTLSRRATLKKYFMNRGIILGFAPFGVFELWSIVFFIFAIPSNFYIVLPTFVAIDLVSRAYEIFRFSDK